jgi:hypothetical protein
MNSIVMYSVSLLQSILPTTAALLTIMISAVNLVNTYREKYRTAAHTADAQHQAQLSANAIGQWGARLPYFLWHLLRSDWARSPLSWPPSWLGPRLWAQHRAGHRRRNLSIHMNTYREKYRTAAHTADAQHQAQLSANGYVQRVLTTKHITNDRCATHNNDICS